MIGLSAKDHLERAFARPPRGCANGHQVHTNGQKQTKPQAELQTELSSWLTVMLVLLS